MERPLKAAALEHAYAMEAPLDKALANGAKALTGRLDEAKCGLPACTSMRMHVPILLVNAAGHHCKGM